MPCRRDRASPSFGACLVRATSTQPAPNSKPAGSPPCDTLRWVGPRTPPPSPKWRSGSKPWHHLTLPYLIHHPPHSRCRYHNAANDSAHPHPHLYYLPHFLHHPHHFLPLHHNVAAALAFKPSSLPCQLPPPPPCVLPCSRRLKPRRGREVALLLLRYSRAAWQGVDACE